jgi:microsomal dipeptidase-like Zn-dependent dipeptidase
MNRVGVMVDVSHVSKECMMQATALSTSPETVNVTLELVRRGYSEEDIRKLWGANTLRVMGENQRRAKPKA